MNKEHVSTGKNVEIAIKNGLLEIGKNREEVDIKILETGGLFKKAKVILAYTEDVITEAPKIEVVDEIVEKKEEQQEKFEEEKIESLDEKEDNKEPQAKQEENKKESIPQNIEKEVKIVDKTALKKRVVDFLEGLLKAVGVEGSVSSVEEENDLKFLISGENVGKLIGYRGETLNAIQYLLASLKERGESKIRLYLDIEGYKDKRAQVLVDLANKMADKAEEIERNVHLDPMTPYERRIVHTALQNRTLVETESTGEGEKRHVVIKFKR